MSGTLRFSRLRLENWRNFVRTDVELQTRAFLVGPNASGKSNLLDVFRFLHDIAAVGGGFQAAVDAKRGGVSRLRALAARRYPEVSVWVDIGDEDTPTLWEYELRFGQDNRQRAVIKKERVAREGRDVFLRPNAEDSLDPERLSQTFLEQVSVNQQYRELSGFFSSVRYLHVVPQLIREPDRSVGRSNDPYGGDFLEQVARTQKRTMEARPDT